MEFITFQTEVAWPGTVNTSLIFQIFLQVMNV